MKIGLVDVDGGSFPNLALMKISAWHKNRGDSVEWCTNPFERFDKVYLSKVFSFSEDPDWYPNAPVVERGGTGYCIETINGVEVFNKEKNKGLPYDVEHIYPDYSLYDLKDTAMGYLTRGCPKGNIHKYCHVAAKEGLCSVRVADLSEWWNGEKNIILLDPNTLACKEWETCFRQLVESGARIDFTQGLDIQLLSKKAAKMLGQMKIKSVHFAWDNYSDKERIVPAFQRLRDNVQIDRRNVSAYVLTNFDSTTEQDLERIYFLRSLDIQPYPMIYNKMEFFTTTGRIRQGAHKKYTKEQIEHACVCRNIQRWCNPFIFWQCERFDDYIAGGKNKWRQT